MKKSLEPFNPKYNYMGSDSLPIKFPRILFNKLDINYFAYQHDGDYGNIKNRIISSNDDLLKRILTENINIKNRLLKSYTYTYHQTYKERFLVDYKILKILLGFHSNIFCAYFIYNSLQLGGLFYKFINNTKLINKE